MTIRAPAPSPIDPASAITPRWIKRIREFDGLEISPCRVVAYGSFDKPILEPCEDAPDLAACWTVYGHLKTGGVDDIEDFHPRLTRSLSTTGLSQSIIIWTATMADDDIRKEATLFPRRRFID